MSKLFHIYEDDLQKLEYILPLIHTACGEALNLPEVQVMFQEAKEVIGNVRWNYGPFLAVEKMPISPLPPLERPEN